MGLVSTLCAVIVGHLFMIPIWAVVGTYYLSVWAGVYWLWLVCVVSYTALILFSSHHLAPNNIRRIPLATWMIRHLDRYFPVTVHTKIKLDPKKQYVAAVHPHSIHCFPLDVFANPESSLARDNPVSIRKFAGLAATIMFKIPVVREIFLYSGYRDARRSVCNNLLKNGYSIFLCTGGESESMATITGRDRVSLIGRMGFVRLALKWGADIVPVYGFGNTTTYKTFGFMRGLRSWIQKKFHIALPIFHGRLGTMMPYQRPVKVVIGEPIKVPKPEKPGEDPPRELVAEYHAKYIKGLKAMYDEWKAEVGFPDNELEVIKA